MPQRRSCPSPLTSRPNAQRSIQSNKCPLRAGRRRARAPPRRARRKEAACGRFVRSMSACRRRALGYSACVRVPQTRAVCQLHHTDTCQLQLPTRAKLDPPRWRPAPPDTTPVTNAKTHVANRGIRNADDTCCWRVIGCAAPAVVPAPSYRDPAFSQQALPILSADVTHEYKGKGSVPVVQTPVLDRPSCREAAAL